MNTASELAQFAFFPVNIPLHVHFTITGSSQSNCNVVLIKLESSDGTAGWGECSPLPVATHDSMESTLEYLSQVLPSLVGRPLEEILRTVQRTLRPQDGTRATSALTGLEMAVYDLLGKILNVSLSQILSSDKRDGIKFEADLTIPALEPDDLNRFWQNFLCINPRLIKIKVTGECIDSDFARVKDSWERVNAHALHTRIKEKPRIVIDGNQGFSVKDALKLAELITKADIPCEFFEQPHSRASFADFIELTQFCPFPICLDESICTVSELRRHLDSNLKFWVNLKTMKSGIFESFQIGKIAKENNIPLMIGGMMETDLSMTCSMQVIQALGGVNWVDLDTPFFLKQLVCKDSVYEKGDMRMKVPDGVGIGCLPVYSIDSRPYQNVEIHNVSHSDKTY